MNILDRAALNNLARKKLEAEKAYREAWDKARETTERLDVDRFWAIMDLWKSSVIRMGRDSKQACDELFRQCVCGELIVRGKTRAAGGGKVTFDELVRFIENYEAITSALYGHLFDVVDGKGDDSYGDLCDSLPLVGREGVKDLLALRNDQENNEAVVSIIEYNCVGHDKDEWVHFIWDGENYFRMFLEDEARRRYSGEAVEHDPKPNVETLV